MAATLSLLFFVFTAGSAGNLQAVTDDLRQLQDVPGLSVAVVREDREVFVGGSGFADLETRRPMTGDTKLYAGSLSKIFTAVLALNLVADGHIALDQAVPGIAGDSPPVTVRQLLTHSSGLSREGNFGYWFSGEFPDGTALARFLTVTTLRSPPGQAVRYSNVGFAALGHFLEVASGQAYTDALRIRVLEPLGLAATGGPGPVPGIATGYTPPGRVLPNEERPFAGVGRQVGDRHVREYHDAQAMTPAFGLYTTARDLDRLARFLLGYGGEEVLPERLRRRMLEPANTRRTLGLGTDALDGRSVVRHNGWFAAHRSHLLIDPETASAVVVMANGDNADTAAVAEALMREIWEAGPKTEPASQ
jgi:CubicO group peptidase (beta-lactamase class C family)